MTSMGAPKECAAAAHAAEEAELKGQAAACVEGSNEEGCKAPLEELSAISGANAARYSVPISACAKQGPAAEAGAWMQRTLDASVGNGLADRVFVERKAVAAPGVRQATLRYGVGRHGQTSLGDIARSGCGVEARAAGVAGCIDELVDAWARAGDEARAKPWLAKAPALGVEPNTSACGALIGACARSGKMERAEWWMLNLASRSTSSATAR